MLHLCGEPHASQHQQAGLLGLRSRPLWSLFFSEEGVCAEGTITGLVDLLIMVLKEAFSRIDFPLL